MISLSNNSVKVKGHYCLKKYSADTNKLKSIHEFDNVITNNALDSFVGAKLNRQYSSFYFVVGTGTSVPMVTNTSLDNQIAKSNKFELKTAGNPVAPDYISKVSGTARFNTGTINNTITEIGLIIGNVYSYEYGLFSRALILDNDNNPTSVTVGDNEYLDCTYELYYYPNFEETIGSFELDGVTYSYVSRPVSITYNLLIHTDGNRNDDYGNIVFAKIEEDNTIAEMTANYYVDSNYNLSLAWEGDYVDGTYKRKFNLSINLDQHNYKTGIGSIVIHCRALVSVYNRITFTPKIPKDNTCTMRFVFETPQLARYTAP